MAQHLTSTPAAASNFVRVSTALTPTMHAWVQAEARALGVSISTYLRLLVAAKKREEGPLQ